MAGHSLSSLFILSLSALFIMPSSAAASCGLTTYWGTNSKEGSLKDACENIYPYYKHIAIAFLTIVDETIVLDLNGHCDPALGNCRKLANEIDFCQSKGVKVLLSLDGSFGNYSSELAETVARYLYYDFLSGGSGPLGKVALDGIDFFINKPGPDRFWVELAKILAQYTTQKGKVHLSAVVPQCVPPVGDDVYGNTIATGLLDYLWVQFYNDPKCDIRVGVSGLLASWKKWSVYLEKTSPGTQLFMGLPASPDAVSGSAGSYIYPCVLIPQILPEIKKANNFGGVMVWNRYYDMQTKYGPDIITPLCGLKSREDLLIHQVV